MRSRILLLAFFAASQFAPAARAVIVYGGDGTGNMTAPGNGAPWNYVGTIGSTTGVFLGNYNGSGWVITANHVGAGDFTLGGTTYSAVGGSGVQIGGADLQVFRISSAPALSNLSLSATAPTFGSSVTMIGNGVGRAAGLTTWHVNTTPDPWVWSLSSFAGETTTKDGYTWNGVNAMRWGTNTIAGATTFNGTSLLLSEFTATAGSAQAATGDSGGGVFYYNGSNWELSGVMAYIDTFSGQPGSTAVVGNLTAFANIADYRGAILTAIPEPAEVGAWFGAVALAAVIWRRRRACGGSAQAESRKRKGAEARK